MRSEILYVLCLMFLAAGCGHPAAETKMTAVPTVPAVVRWLPAKEDATSSLATESPLNPGNVDEYLFLPGVQYVDLRSSAQIVSEGSIAGFVNIPFYEALVSWKPQDTILFYMKKGEDADQYVGSVGTFYPSYEESEELLKQLFQRDSPIVFFSTAGVEAAYMINLLVQYGYDPALLYHAGSFTTSMGASLSYRDRKDHRYYIPGTDVYTVSTAYSWNRLTPRG